MQTIIPVESLSDAVHTTEAAEILATGLIRLRKAQQDSNFPLDFLPTGSVHHDRYPNGENP